MTRVRTNFVSGNVDNAPLAVGDQTLESADLADLPAIASPDIAVLVLGPLTETPEIVHVTAHSAGATTATIARGQEGSAEAEWAQGTGWDHTPTADDYGAAFANDGVNGVIIPEEIGYGWVVGSDQFDDTGTGNEDSRAFFDKANGAFRAGSVAGTEWDAANRGTNSYAEGEGTTASGGPSHAEGRFTEASNIASHAEGDATTASGTYSHAEGTGSTAGSAGSHAEGDRTQSIHQYTHTEGQLTEASGGRAHAEGTSTTASGTSSHAEGNGATASGQNAHAEGANTAAQGHHSHAEGNGSTAAVDYSHAEGRETWVDGIAGHVEGGWSEAVGDYSHAEGYSSRASRFGQHAHSGGPFAFGDPAGEAQNSEWHGLAETTDATATTLAAKNDPAAIDNLWRLDADRAYQVKMQAIALRTDAEGEAAGFTWEGVVVRDTNGGPRIVGTPVTQNWADTNAGAWTLDVTINTADFADPYLELTATGESGKTIRWSATLYVTEVG